MAKGMFSDIFSPTLRDLRAEEAAEEQIHQFQARDPFGAMAHTAYSGGTLAGKGLGRAVVAAAGGDPRTPSERNVAAIEAAKQQVAQLGFNPEDPKSIDAFYKQVIQILQKQGLAAEALAVAKEWNAEKNTRVEQGFKERRLEREEQRDRDQFALGVLRIASAEEIARAKNANAKEIADAKLTAEQLRQGPFKSIDYGDRVDIINRHGEVVSSKPKAMSPKDDAKDGAKKKAAEEAYGEYLAGLQRQYNAAVQLHNHPGVSGMTGRIGRLVGTEGMAGQTATTVASGPTRAALALHEQVVGGAFLAGLAKLKAASAAYGGTGTGLGAVSEKEGDKVQSDAAALNRAQDAADYRKQLATYIRELEGHADRLAAGAQTDQISPKPLTKQPLMLPRGSAAPAPSAPAPAAPAPAAPAAPAAPTTPAGWTPEKEQRYQELLKKQNGT